MSFWSKLLNTIRPAQLDDEIAAEIEDHIARRTASLESDGLPPAEARRRAALAFGNAASIRDQGRDIRSWPLADSVVRDIRHALRGMRRSPAFAITAVVTLALTTGAVTALYSVVDAAMFRPLPVGSPDRLFTLVATEPSPGAAVVAAERTTFSVPAYRDFRDALGDAASLSLFSRPARVEMQATSEPSAPVELAVSQFVDDNAFDVLRVPAAAGTTAMARGNASAVILSWDFWQRQFAGSPAIVGRIIRVDGRPAEVIGVAAPGFSGIEPGTFVDLWRPLAAFDPGALTNRSFHWGSLVGRLGDTTTIETVHGRLRAAYAQDLIERETADGTIDRSAASLVVRAAATGISDTRTRLSRPLYALLGIALLTALIASVNVGSLLMARAASRTVEMAVRASLGAGRLRLLQQLAIEHMVLALAGGAGGWLVGALAAPQAGALLSAGREPMRFAVGMNARVLLACAVLSLVCGLFLGVLPACYALSTRQMAKLRAASGAGSLGNFGSALVAGQVAIAFCLVATGLAFTFSVRSLFAVEPGFDPHGVTVVSIGADRALPMPAVEQFQGRVAAQPEVRNAAVAWWAVFQGNRRMERVLVPGRTPPEREEIFYRVSPNYLATLGTRLLDGRDFTFADTDGSSPVPTIVNRTFARRYFGVDAVVGRTFQRADGTSHRIVGLAADSYYDDLRRGPDALAYFPMKPPRWLTLYVRSDASAGRIVEIARREAGALGSGAHVIEAVTLDDLVAGSLQRETLLAAAGGMFAAIGLLIATVGIFGFLTFAVSSRRQEIALRAALGAAPQRLTRLVLASVLRPVAAGLLLGLVAAIYTIRLAGSLLFGVGPLDPAVLVGTTVVFVAAAAAAAVLPVRRATAVDPASVFRT
jgi:predicted permease